MADASMFDPQSFLDATMDAPLEKRDPLPTDRDYFATIGEIKSRVWTKKDDPSKNGIAWDIPLRIEVPADLQQSLGVGPNVTLTDGIFIDLNEAGHIDGAKGRNTALRRYREATGMNEPGQTFSARAMQGRQVRVKLKHELYNDTIQERIAGVVKV